MGEERAEPPGYDRQAESTRTVMEKLSRDLIADLPEPWHGASGFLVELHDEDLLILLTWLWLWDLWRDASPYALDGPSTRYARNPWTGVQNPVGKIITQVRRRSPAPLHADDLADLKATLNERIAKLAPEGSLHD
jgi:hypothetical protein